MIWCYERKSLRVESTIQIEYLDDIVRLEMICTWQKKIGSKWYGGYLKSLLAKDSRTRGCGGLNQNANWAQRVGNPKHYCAWRVGNPKHWVFGPNQYTLASTLGCECGLRHICPRLWYCRARSRPGWRWKVCMVSGGSVSITWPCGASIQEAVTVCSWHDLTWNLSQVILCKVQF